MGKRKSKARVMKKTIQTVPTQFDCIFCNHAKTVECKLNMASSVGTIRCRVCQVTFQMEINHLTEPIDIYGEWIDETEKANRVDRDDPASAVTSASASQRNRDSDRRRDAEDDDDDDDDGRGRGRYDEAEEVSDVDSDEDRPAPKKRRDADEDDEDDDDDDDDALDVTNEDGDEDDD